MIEIGKTYEVACPFVRDVFDWYDSEGPTQTLTWKPGIVWEHEGDAIAHGMGKVIYRVVDVHTLPRPYPPRVFFTRKWVSPDGKTFGSGKLRIMTREAFARRLSGYRFAGSDDCGGDFEVCDITEADRSRLLARAA